jgi:hypothetical protein
LLYKFTGSIFHISNSQFVGDKLFLNPIMRDIDMTINEAWYQDKDRDRDIHEKWYIVNQWEVNKNKGIYPSIYLSISLSTYFIIYLLHYLIIYLSNYLSGYLIIYLIYINL